MPLFFRRLAALFLLLLPPWLAVQGAIKVADALSGPLQAWLDPALARLNALPSLVAALLAGDYGLVAMLPFLFLYALPTALIMALLGRALKKSGLLDWAGALLHPWTLKLGLQGEDLVRVLQGFGCNVPAIDDSAKHCHGCTKEACVSAIAFGAACSYQHPASLAVLAAAGRADLAVAYLGLLVGTTALYLAVFYGRQTNLAKLVPAPKAPKRLRWPELLDLGRHGWSEGLSFVKDVATVFAGVCLLAALAAWSGLLGLLSRALGPALGWLALPPESAPAVVMSAVRKNGMASVLIEPGGGLRIALPSASQLLAVVLFAGVVVPCSVTVLAMAKALGPRRAASLVLRQALAGAALAGALAWSGRLFHF